MAFTFHFFTFLLYFGVQLFGEVAEWSKAHAWKACIPCGTESGVRIPSSPPDLIN